ncbi:phage tail tape measure protein [Vreelandella neptunia]|uniref:Phage tail tape measure protein n=1 Tax=Vreelandella neptunia TaxID=115551 RepID=A0ABZ0YKL6_9GAMM|nr:phage tail tape measure protein [Halomonas neptunia]MDN3562123.1 phage tail tape measure protein [Halomonas neptunia]WQH11825.1 phage tail tape measure protein [Halomonas neptunia]
MAQNLRLQVMLNAVDRVTGPLKRMRQGAGQTAQAMRETRDRLKTLQATQKDISSFRTLKNQSEATGRAMREQQERIRRLSRQMQSNQGDTAALANERRKAILQARQLSQRYDSERQKLQRLRTSLNNSGISTHNLSQDQQRLANEIRQANQQMEAQKRKLQRIAEQQRRAAQASEQYQRSLSRDQSIAGAGAMGAGVGTAGVVAMGTQALMNQSSGARLAAQQGEGNEEATRYREVITQVYTTGRGQGLEQVTEAVSVLASQFESLGATTNEELGAITQQALTLTDTFNIDLAEAAQTAGIMVQNGLATNATEAFDLMARGMQEVSASMRHELPEILHEYGTNFRALGFDGKESLNMLVAAAEQGRFALDKTGDALKEFTIRGSDMSKASVEAYDAIGLNAQEMADAIAGGGDRAGAALTTTAQRLLEIENPAQRANAAIALFGTPIEDLSVDQIPAFLRGLGQTNDRMGDVTGTAQRMADTLGNNAGSALKRVQRALGGAFMGVLDEVDDTIIRVSNNVTAWMQANPELTSTLTKAAIALAGLVAAGGAFIAVAGSILGPLALMRFGASMLGINVGGLGQALGWLARTAIPWVAGALKGLLVAMGPIGWGIAAIAGAAFLIYKYWEPIKGFFLGLWQQVKNAFSEGVDGVAKLLINWSPLGLIHGAFIGALDLLGISVPEGFRDLGGFVIDGLIGGLEGKIAALRERITSIATGVMDWFKGVLGINSPSRVFEGFGVNIVEGMINGIASMAGALRDQVMGMAANIAGWVQDAMTSAWDSIGNGANQAMQWGRETAAGMGQGIRDGANRATESAANLANGVTDTVRGWLDIHSPSRVFATIGGYISQGLANGIEADADSPVKQVRSLTNHLRNAAGGLMLGAGLSTGAAANVDTGSIQIDARPPLQSHTSQSSGGLVIHGGINIQVHATPGMDEQALARLVNEQVQRALQQAQQQAAAARRRNFHDND